MGGKKRINKKLRHDCQGLLPCIDLAWIGLAGVGLVWSEALARLRPSQAVAQPGWVGQPRRLVVWCGQWTTGHTGQPLLVRWHAG